LPHGTYHKSQFRLSVNQQEKFFGKTFLHIGILHGTYVKAQYAIYHGFFLLKSKTGSVNVSKNAQGWNKI
jgi:hypothetical protein